jgi:hypothetical protein
MRSSPDARASFHNSHHLRRPTLLALPDRAPGRIRSAMPSDSLSGRDRDQSLQPPMPRTTADRGHRHATPPCQSMEPPHQSRQDHHLLEVHPKTSASDISLLIHAVTVLNLVVKDVLIGNEIITIRDSISIESFCCPWNQNAAAGLLNGMVRRFSQWRWDVRDAGGTIRWNCTHWALISVRLCFTQ